MLCDVKHCDFFNIKIFNNKK